jgi:hypothetical protein
MTSPELTSDIDQTWTTLLNTLFDPNEDVLAFYEAWGLQETFTGDERNRSWAGARPGAVHYTAIHSSLGIVIQRLWGSDSSWKLEPSRQRLGSFLESRTTSQIRFRLAQIALRLLMCR